MLSNKATSISSAITKLHFGENELNLAYDKTCSETNDWIFSRCTSEVSIESVSKMRTNVISGK